MSKTVLITGCSTGIGRDVAKQLAQSGYTVVATARRAETLADLQTALRLPLDVTDAESVASAVTETIRRFGRIDFLINNAGYAVRGAVEEVPPQAVQEMFDVNVYGILRMIRSVVPHMRRQKAGCIVNIGSVAGKLVLPANGTYSATKFALEALSDALRLELAPFGIQVVLIEPGNIRTHFVETAHGHTGNTLTNPDSPYRRLYQNYARIASAMRQNDPGPEIVSQVVQQAIESSHPRARYLVSVPLSNRVVLHLNDALKDFALKRMLKIDTRE